MTEPRRDFSADAATWTSPNPAGPTRARYFLVVVVLLVVGGLVAVTVFDDETPHFSLFLQGASLIVIAVLLARNGQSSTTADRGGLSIKSPKPRSADWSEIEDLQVVGRFKWSKKVQAQLANGVTWTLPHVPAKDLPAVLCWPTMDEWDAHVSKEREEATVEHSDNFTARLRLATADEVDAIAQFGDQVVPAHYEPILGADAATAQLSGWEPDGLEPAVLDGRVHVALAEDEIIGVVETGQMNGEEVIWKLYVAPGFRGRSLGIALLRLAVESLPAGTQHVLVEHFAGNVRAGAFYEREGFVVIKTDPATSGDVNAGVVWRRLNLADGPQDGSRA